MKYFDENKLFGWFVEDDGHREVFKTPFLQDGYVCATNGHVLIRVKAELLTEKYEEVATPIISRIIPQRNTDIEISQSAIFNALHNAKMVEDSGVFQLYVYCKECKGTGEVDWNYYDRKGNYHTSSHECPICEGECTVPACTDETFGLYDCVFSGNSIIRLYEAMRILNMETIRYVATYQNNANMFSNNDGIEFILMPMIDTKPTQWIVKKGGANE